MNQPEYVDCVMPAAGLSSRMGDWKMMLPYRHQTILDASIENALRFCSRVILVAGYRSNELVERYKLKQGVKMVVNAHFESGMFSSIQQGVSAVETDHFFICHGDMPCITSDIYRQVWAQRGSQTVFPGIPDKPGHPVLLPSTLIAEIQQSGISGKMKRIIFNHEVKYVGLTMPEIYLDVDTPQAYRKLCDSAHAGYQSES
ncbi:molybdenum cofactor cytidylyltransferase [Photobacterium sp. SDRW27]|uniref:molybdenum cofactor cytidylyltransferase n=1 Tax=Photobacterium obscurum TaxID=2829490 RepID=UPI00224378B5|nr:molybdenum cofactor cytidylyltransferase [Photobacterium obscurum]MCW8331173.1 molybdenum cofactor cytidylyltransferase [Photobacterium obscurum]